jgi:acetolactate synthase-1/2/3 large subunit
MMKTTDKILLEKKEETIQISGAEALIRSLEYQGVKTIFGYPGGAIMPVYDVLYNHREMHHILVRHEQAAAHAAEGFARATDGVGVCLVTSGPGATNTVTGISDAMIDSTPIVVIAGQVATSSLGMDAFQEVDLVGITQPICKWSYQIRSAADVAWAVARAFYIAKSGRPGPVVLDFTRNAQNDMTHYRPTKVNFVRGYQPVPDWDEKFIEKAARLINEAQRPLVLAGHGIELANAQKEFGEMIEKADLPFGSTLLGLSVLPSDHPLNMGMLGMHGNLAPNVMTNECDVLIAVGMRFDDRVTGKLSAYAPQAKVIHFDIDPAEINKTIKADVPVLGDCRRTLAAVNKLLKSAKHTEWINSFAPYKEKEMQKVIHPELHPSSSFLSMGEVVEAVSEATYHKAILVTDVGQNQMISARYFKFSEERSILTSGGAGTMGYGLPAAVGATFARPDRTVCLFTGDGGLQMNLQEFGTIMEQKAPVKIILLNNNFLGNVRQWQAMFFHHHYSFTPMMNPDYPTIASAYGIPSRRVVKHEELKAAIDEMLQTDGPFLLEACVAEEGNVLPMTPPGSPVNEMILEIK